MTPEHTERERLRRELESQLLSHVSHELRSPLAGVYQFVTLVLDGHAGPTSDVQREYLDGALRNLRQLQGKIDDLLEATRAESDELSVRPEPIELAPSVDDALAAMRQPAAERLISLQHHVADDLPRAHADPDRVRQVVRSLLDNAIKFTPPGGSVTVRTGRHPSDEDALSVRVEDTGRGIDTERSERIFDRLQGDPRAESSRKGLGLGLYIVRTLVERQGGEIWVDPSRTDGCAIAFSVPICSPHA